MKLEEIITENCIDLDLKADSKTEVIRKLVEILYQNDRIEDKEIFLNSVFEREQIETTDMGIGVAIPHGISDTVTRPSVIIGRLKNPIAWDDQKNENPKDHIFAVFLLASSKKIKGNDHLEMISRIATLLINDDFVHILQTTTDKQNLIQSINTLLGEE